MLGWKFIWNGLKVIIPAAAMLTFACNSLPPIYRNPGLDLSRKKANSSSKDPSARPARKGTYFVTLGGPDSRSARGRYEQCETDGVRARIIRQSNGTRAVYAYGWDAREAEVFKGKRVEIVGRMTWRPGDLKPGTMNTKRILPLPHFVSVTGIRKALLIGEGSYGKFSGDCLK